MTKFASTVLAFVLLSSASTVFAGAKQSWPLQIDLAGRHAWGDVSATRAAADANAYVTCTVWTAASAGASSLTCNGAISATTSFSCTTNSPTAAMVDAARSIEGDSWVSVYWDATGKCTNIDVRKSSLIAPKAP